MSPSKLDALAKAMTSNRETSLPISPTRTTDKTAASKKPAGSAGAKSASFGKSPSSTSGDKMAPKPTNSTGAGRKDTPSTPKTESAPRVRKQRPAASPSAADKDSTGSSAPPSKKQKVTPAKQPLVAKNVSAQKTASNTSTATNLSTVAPARPRGRPPGSGGGTSARKPRATAPSSGGQMKAENSPPLDNLRRSAKPKTNNNKAVQPWAVVPETIRRFTSDDISLLDNGMFADATIVCLKHEWKVHKTILCTRSKWFYNAFHGEKADGQTGVVNLHGTEIADVDTLLRFIYSGSLDKDKFSPEKCDFLTYANIFKLGQTFDQQPLSDDALSFLGQYCDQKLVEICGYDVSQSGRHGTVDQIRGSPDKYIKNLLKAIWAAYEGIEGDTRLQSLLASFVWAGRDRLLRCDGFVDLAEKCPRFGNDIFKLMLGHNSSQWLPSAAVVHELCTGFDHSRKTQHPDRCEKCDEVFDEDDVRKALYNPFKVAVRAGAWCGPCVDKHPGPAPLWRVVVAEPKDEE